MSVHREPMTALISVLICLETTPACVRVDTNSRVISTDAPLCSHIFSRQASLARQAFLITTGSRSKTGKNLTLKKEVLCNHM